jgi:hypothetical protein
MTKLTKVSVAAAGLVANLTSLIEAWEPGALASERQFQDSLLHFIRENVPTDCRVEREYRHSGTTTDIFVHWNGLVFKGEVFLEVKRNLNKKAILDRLVGQVESLEPGKRDIVVVLVGDTDRALLGRLKAKYAAFEDALPEPRMAIVVK